MNPNQQFDTNSQHPSAYSDSHAAYQPPMPPLPPLQPVVMPYAAPAHPTPASATASFPHSADPMAPTPVVKVLSPVGVEYVFLTITLLTGASSLVGALLVLVNGGANFIALAFPIATLLVTVPTFAALFLHLKKLELRNPQLRFDPSKRRSTQATQIISFVVCLFTTVGFFSAIFASLGGSSGVTIGKAALDALCVLVVAGGILAYYWRDEHAARA